MEVSIRDNARERPKVGFTTILAWETTHLLLIRLIHVWEYWDVVRTPPTCKVHCLAISVEFLRLDDTLALKDDDF